MCTDRSKCCFGAAFGCVVTHPTRWPGAELVLSLPHAVGNVIGDIVVDAVDIIDVDVAC